MTNLSTTARSIDRRFMRIAAKLAARGMGRVEPNPCVGAVVVRNGQIIGRGYHRGFGQPHAEVEAITDCGRRGNGTVGASMYVTLEPCAHAGKTPPCTDAILAASISEVIFGVGDPNPVAQGGAQRLRSAGVTVRECAEPLETLLVSAPFRKRAVEALPWVIAKWAQSIDGKIARPGGDSKWISNSVSRLCVHRLRSRVDAIVVGINTIIQDDSLLTVRGVPTKRTPVRVILDSTLRIPMDSQVVITARDIPTYLFCSLESLANREERERELVARGVEVVGVPSNEGLVSAIEVLRFLGKSVGAERVLIEGGAHVLGAFLSAGLVDEVRLFQAPFFLPEPGSLEAIRLPKGCDFLGSEHYFLHRAQRLQSDIQARYVRSRYARSGLL